MAPHTRRWSTFTPAARTRYSVDACTVELSGFLVCADILQHVLLWVDPATMARAAGTCTTWFAVADTLGVWGAIINGRRGTMREQLCLWGADRGMYGATARHAIRHGFKKGDALPFWDMEFRKLGPGATWRHRLDVVAKHSFVPQGGIFFGGAASPDVEDDDEAAVAPMVAAVGECPLVIPGCTDAGGEMCGYSRRRRGRQRRRQAVTCNGSGKAYCEQCRQSRRRCRCTCGGCARPAVRCACYEGVARRERRAAAAITFPPGPAVDGDGSDDGAGGWDDPDAVPAQPRRYDALTLKALARAEEPGVAGEVVETSTVPRVQPQWGRPAAVTPLLAPKTKTCPAARLSRRKLKAPRPAPSPTSYAFDASEWGAFRQFCWEKGGHGVDG